MEHKLAVLLHPVNLECSTTLLKSLQLLTSYFQLFKIQRSPFELKSEINIFGNNVTCHSNGLVLPIGFTDINAN